MRLSRAMITVQIARHSAESTGMLRFPRVRVTERWRLGFVGEVGGGERGVGVADKATSVMCGSCSRGLMSYSQNTQEVGPAEGGATELENLKDNFKLKY